MKAASTSRRVNRKDGSATRATLARCVLEGLEARLLLDPKNIAEIAPYNCDDYTDGPFRYGDGGIKIDHRDLWSEGFGMPWGQERSWSNMDLGAPFEKDILIGNGWYSSSLPYIVQDGDDDTSVGDTFVVFKSATDSLFFHTPPSPPVTYTPTYETNATLAFDSTADEFVLTEANGTRYFFYDVNSPTISDLQGRLKRILDPKGNALNVEYETDSGQLGDAARIDYVERSSGSGASLRKETWDFDYNKALTAGIQTVPDQRRIARVILKHQKGTGNVEIVRMVSYGYYTDTTDDGNLNDLQFAATSETATELGVSISSSGSSTTATANTTAAHGYQDGDLVVIRRTDGQPASNEEYYFGTFVIDVTDSDTFTYEMQGDPADSVNGTLKVNKPLDVYYYRYYKPSETGGYRGGLKLVFGPESFERLRAAFPSDYITQSPSNVQQYADNYFEYDTITAPPTGEIEHPVTKEMVQGAGCSVCTGGVGTFLYEYEPRGSDIDDLNDWQMKTTETLPDGNENIVYTNDAGQVLVKIFRDTSFNPDRDWITAWQYNAKGQVTLRAQPSAVTTTNETGATSLITDTNISTTYYLRPNDGLIEVTEYGTSTTANTTTPGNVIGYFKSRSLKQGNNDATPDTLESRDYIERTAGGLTVYPVKNVKTYRNSTSGETTSYTYDWQGSTVQMLSQTASLPPVGTGQNGDGASDTITTYFDAYGRPEWERDEDGAITHYAYDQLTGGVSTLIRDVDTTQITGEPNEGILGAWVTPTGFGRHLTTTTSFDGLGRPTKIEAPGSRTTYVDYDDTTADGDPEEVRTYVGWNTTTDAPTGPTHVVRHDPNGYYEEYLTISEPPELTSDEPNGNETFDANDIQTMRRERVNAAGQLVEVDRYFSMPTYPNVGTEGTHFWRTKYQYDTRGRRSRVFVPTRMDGSTPLGTLTKMDYDALGRVAKVWVGTTDANLTQTVENEYDDPTEASSDGGVGDGNLTKRTEFRGTGQDARVTRMAYDWRNRLALSKVGVQASESSSLSVQRPITYYEYNNFDQATLMETFDGDNVAITDSNGAPVKPTNKLRSRETIEYDDRGRVFAKHQFSVTYTEGSGPPDFNVSTSSLNTNYWYDGRGNVIKVDEPGGLVTKNKYNGVGWLIKTYKTDDNAESGYSAATDVAGDIVLEQVQTDYDDSGNPILWTAKERFHTETAANELGNATTSPKARVTLRAAHYDEANRLTHEIDVGTNYDAGQQNFTLHENLTTQVPTRADTALVTSYEYNSAGWVEFISHPREIGSPTPVPIKDKFEYDPFGRKTKHIESYDDGNPNTGNADRDRVTTYAYDGADHLVKMTALLPDGPDGGTDPDVQETEYVYDVTTSAGSDMFSRDLISAIKYPDPTTGIASDSEKELIAYNLRGERKSFTDRNATKHTYSYDVTGRMTEDSVIGNLGSGVDTAVQNLSFTFDSAGRPEKFTSKNSGGTVVNEVKREYNGLGQLTKEWQEHSGAVSTSTSLLVKYEYSADNRSRLTKRTFPALDAAMFPRALHYRYSSGVDSNMSRVSELASAASGGTVYESYSYLGLDTIINRAHPEPGINLTYDSGNDTIVGDAGDRYVGLDRFGRVVDQRWDDANSTTDTDRFQYGYDRNSNRLYRENMLNHNFDELYHADDDGNGDPEGYDKLNRLTEFQRGELDEDRNEVKGEARAQVWDLTALGNWNSVTTDGTEEPRTHNAQNQLTSGAQSYTYDGNGNLTGKDPTTRPGGQVLGYDAWNRLTAVTTLASSQNGDATMHFSYDALGRRIIEGPVTFFGWTSNDMPVHLYYSDQWQVIHERQEIEGGGGSSANELPGGAGEGGFGSYTMETDYVWSLAYIDALVLRSRDLDLNPSNGLEERLYVQHDANFNVTAIVNASGTVQERYVYDPYGSFTVLDANWSNDSDGISDFGWAYLHQGGRYEAESGLYHFRHRDYSPTLGRWVQQDPQGYVDGYNLYQYVKSSPVAKVDPMGLGEMGLEYPGWWKDWPKPPPPGGPHPLFGQDCCLKSAPHWQVFGYDSFGDCVKCTAKAYAPPLGVGAAAGASGLTGNILVAAGKRIAGGFFAVQAAATGGYMAGLFPGAALACSRMECVQQGKYDAKGNCV